MCSGEEPTSLLHLLPGLLPAIESAVQFVDLITGLTEQLGGFLAAAATAAIEGHRLFLLQKRIGHLDKLGVEDIDIQAAGDMAFGIFSGGAYIQTRP